MESDQTGSSFAGKKPGPLVDTKLMWASSCPLVQVSSSLLSCTSKSFASGMREGSLWLHPVPVGPGGPCPLLGLTVQDMGVVEGGQQTTTWWKDFCIKMRVREREMLPYWGRDGSKDGNWLCSVVACERRKGNVLKLECRKNIWGLCWEDGWMLRDTA